MAKRATKKKPAKATEATDTSHLDDIPPAPEPDDFPQAAPVVFREPQLDKPAGLLMDFLIDNFKHQPKPWQEMVEDEQLRLLNQARDAVKQTLKALHAHLAARDYKAIELSVNKVALKSGDKIELGLVSGRLPPRSVEVISHTPGTVVTVVCASYEEWLEGLEDIVPDPDQVDAFGAREGDPMPGFDVGPDPDAMETIDPATGEIIAHTGAPA